MPWTRLRMLTGGIPLRLERHLQKRLADETGVFESLCYDGYSCGAGGEIKDCKIFYFTYIVISFKSGVNLRTISLLFTSG